MAKQLTVLWIGAHPDDCEFMAAGTMILLGKKGCKLHIATMTPGDCGTMEYSTEEIARIRLGEARASAARIGAEYHCMGEKDLLVLHTEAALKKVTELVRRVQPDIVFTQSPEDYMLDHEAASSLARTACFTGPMPNFHTDLFPCAARTKKVPHLYYADAMGFTDIYGRPIPASIYVDISSVIATKAKMLACHESQRSWLKAQHGIDAYLDEMRHIGATRGKEIGVRYAEGFRQHLGHAYPADNILKKLLGDLVTEKQAYVAD